MAATDVTRPARRKPRRTTPSLTDAELREHERTAMSVLRARFPRLDEDELRDCCQQAFLEAWPKRHEYDGTFGALLVTTALRRATDHWKRYRSRHELLDPTLADDEPLLAGADDSLDPAAIVLRDVELQRGAELLAMMPAHHQRVWRAYVDSGARHSAAGVAAIAEAEGLKPRQVTKIVDKVKEKARRIAAASLTPDLEHDAAYCDRLAARISAHVATGGDDLAARHLESCAYCREVFERARRIERAAAALLPPLPLLEATGGGSSIADWLADRWLSGRARAAELAASVQPTGRTSDLVTGGKAWLAAAAIATAGSTATVATVADRSSEPVPKERVVAAPAVTSQAEPTVPQPSGAGRTATVTHRTERKEPGQAPKRNKAKTTTSTSTSPPAQQTTVQSPPAREPEPTTPGAPEQPTPQPQKPEPKGAMDEFGIER